MPKILRKHQKIFATSAVNNGQFGSAQLGTKLLTSDLDQIQALGAYDNGWLDAVIGTKKFPPLEEMQSLQYMNTWQLAYLFQEGIPEYLAATTYYVNSIVKKPGTYELYGSKIINNTGNALPNAVSDANWQFLIDLSLNNKFAYGVGAGTVNTYTVTTTPVFSALYDGLIFAAKINITNTAAATLNPNATGVLAITNQNAALVGGELRANTDYLFMYDAAQTKFQVLNPSVIQATETLPGIAEIATQAEVNTGTDDLRFITPLKFATRLASTTLTGLIEIATNAEALAGVSTSLAMTPDDVTYVFATPKLNNSNAGYQKLPGGFLMQMGEISIVSVTNSYVDAVFNFATPFVSYFKATLAIRTNATAGDQYRANILSQTLSTLTIRLYTIGVGGVSVPIEIVAMGF